jgi:hypothetical protein
MKTYKGVDVFLTSALNEGETSASLSGCYNFEERAHGTHWIGWVSPSAGLDTVK